MHVRGAGRCYGIRWSYRSRCDSGLAAAGVNPLRFDIRESNSGARADLRDVSALRSAVQKSTGIIHLGAVSRVVWGERSPQTCWNVNVESTRSLLKMALDHPGRPWILYASSREVYGQQHSFPVRESAPLAPMNIYARSKLAAEELVWQAREAGLRSAVLRFSSVYGDIEDHADRVVPAFACAAARGSVMQINGPSCRFDFTHVSDVADGVLKVVEMLCLGEQDLPAIHLVSGVGTTLKELSEVAAAANSLPVKTVEAPSRTFDVHTFWGDPGRAAEILGWRSVIPLREGVGRLVMEFKAQSPLKDKNLRGLELRPASRFSPEA
jgi:nucleoside-diphosphate-sugar epimerase